MIGHWANRWLATERQTGREQEPGQRQPAADGRLCQRTTATVDGWRNDEGPLGGGDWEAEEELYSVYTIPAAINIEANGGFQWQ